MFGNPQPLFHLTPTGPQPERLPNDKYPNIYNTFLIKENPEIEAWIKEAFPTFQWVSKINPLHKKLFANSPRLPFTDNAFGNHIKQVHIVIKTLEQFLKSIEQTNLPSKSITFDSFTVHWVMTTLTETHPSGGSPFVTFNMQIGYDGGSYE